MPKGLQAQLSHRGTLLVGEKKEKAEGEVEREMDSLFKFSFQAPDN